MAVIAASRLPKAVMTITGTSGWVRTIAVAELEAVHFAHVDVGDDGVELGGGERASASAAVVRQVTSKPMGGRRSASISHMLCTSSTTRTRARGRVAHAARWGGALPRTRRGARSRNDRRARPASTAIHPP
jgi:hypothetical protein